MNLMIKSPMFCRFRNCAFPHYMPVLLACMAVSMPLRAEDVLYLLNGDRLVGAAGSFTGTRLTWQSGWSDASTEIAGAYIHILRLGVPGDPVPQPEPQPEPQAPPPQATARVKWVHGDVMNVDLLELGADRLRLSIPGGTTFDAYLGMVREVSFFPQTEDAGPLEVSLWAAEWQAREGSHQQNQPRLIPRNIRRGLHIPSGQQIHRRLPQYPERFMLEVDLAVLEGTTHYTLSFFTPAQDTNARQFGLHLMAATGRLLSVHEFTSGQQNRVLNDRFPENQEMAGTHAWRVYFNQVNRNATVYFNDVEVASWELSEDLAKYLQEETLVRMTLLRGDVVMEGLRVIPWDGEFYPDVPDIPEDGVLVVPWEGAPFPAVWTGLGEDSLLFETPDGHPLQQAFGDVRLIRMAADTRDVPRKRARDLEVSQVHTQNFLTLQLQHWDATHIYGVSDAWEGVLKLPRSWAQEIRFNIHTPFVDAPVRARPPRSTTHRTHTL